MLLFLMLIFLTAYMIPTVKMARVKAWQLQQSYAAKKTKTYPERKLEYDYPSAKYGYVNGVIVKLAQLCNTCGAESDFHPGGQHQSIRWFDNESYKACKNFVSWNGEKKHWPVQTLPEHEGEVPPMIAKSLFLSLGWPLVMSKAGYDRVKPDYSKFATPPAAVRKELELKAREETIDAQERELKIGPYRED